MNRVPPEVWKRAFAIIAFAFILRVAFMRWHHSWITDDLQAITSLAFILVAIFLTCSLFIGILRDFSPQVRDGWTSIVRLIFVIAIGFSSGLLLPGALHGQPIPPFDFFNALLVALPFWLFCYILEQVIR